MSALTLALAAYDTYVVASTTAAPSAPAESPSTRPSLPSVPDSCLLPTPPPSQPVPTSHGLPSPIPCIRTNEHLAVLLPKHLWKADSLASRCDNFFCFVKFSLFERRHHCRKCGGVFCAKCTLRKTPLLDVSNLDFLHPPRNVPLSTFESPCSPIISGRVCDDCWEQIHGNPTPRTPELVHSSPIFVGQKVISESSSLASSLSTPPNGLGPILRRSIRPMGSMSSLGSTSRRLRAVQFALPETVAEAGIVASQPSLGELDAYPLKHASAVCKATGGGRWEPRPCPTPPNYRIPGCKAPFEIEMEREEEEARLFRLNPVVRDGEFQYRFVRDPEPAVMPRSPFQLSTF